MKDDLTLFDIDGDYDDFGKICLGLGVEINTPGWTDKFGEKLYKYIVDNNLPKVKTLSLFSGAGGLDIGFHDLGFEIVSSVEIEKSFCDTLRLNSGENKIFQNSKVNCIDIREFYGENIGQVDWIIGGPPCQTFSAAGRRASGVLGTSDARGVLFKEYVRLLKKFKPKGFLFENVYGIVGAQKGEPLKEIISAFKEAGYILYYRVLDAADYGTPQHRERLILVGLQNGEFRFPRPTNGPDSINQIPFYNAGTAISDIVLTQEESKEGINGKYGYLLKDIPPGLNYSFYTKEMGHPMPIFAWRSKFSDFLYKADPNAPVRTIKASGGQYTGPLHWNNRYFSLSEYKRLQTFPDNYNISGSKQIAVKQIGNSVPPQLARILALAIRIQVFGTSFPFNFEFISNDSELSFRKRKRNLTLEYQQKAKKALIKQSPIAVDYIQEKKEIFLSINEKFDINLSDREGTYKVRINWTKQFLQIVIDYSNNNIKNSYTKIDIVPITQWTLPIEHISLLAYGNSWHIVTAAWKVLDLELKEHSLKADLIQLNGYYQNPSLIKCVVRTEGVSDSNILTPIIHGKCIQRNCSTKELASVWNIDSKEVYAKALMLKGLGYEIRNKNTNPQMKNDEWLIPYKFPTLTPQSVQLYKQL